MIDFMTYIICIYVGVMFGFLIAAIFAAADR